MTDENAFKYSENMLRNELSVVFSSLYFADKQMQEVLFDSYFLNFRNLILYAHNNNIDEMDYVRSIRSVLLSYPKVYERY